MRGQGDFEFLGRLEITVMGDLPTSDSPHSFDWIEFRGIRWQEEAHQPVLVAGEEVFQISCFVPTGIVENKV